MSPKFNRDPDEELPDESSNGSAKGKYDRALSRMVHPGDDSLDTPEIQKEGKKVPLPFEPRCTVCQSPYRNWIDAMLARTGASYTQIAKQVPGADGRKLDRRAVSHHAKNHLGFAEDSVRAILESEAEQQLQDYDSNVRGAITKRGVLEVIMRKAYDDVMAGRVTAEVKDLLAIIQALEKMDEVTTEAQVGYLRAQADAFMRAIREIVPDEFWEPIMTRAREILAQEGMTYEPPIEGEAADVTPPPLPPAD